MAWCEIHECPLNACDCDIRPTRTEQADPNCPCCHGTGLTSALLTEEELTSGIVHKTIACLCTRH